MNKADLKKLKKICDSIRAKDEYSNEISKLWSRYTMWLRGSAPRYRLRETDTGDVELTVGYRGPVVAKGNAAVEKFLRKLIEEIRRERNSAEDAEAVIYQVTTSQDKMGRLHTEYFGSAEEVLREHKGRIDPSSGHPRLDGFVGPFSNGTKNGKKVLLYEDKNTYLSMDSKAKTAELKGDYTKDAETHYLINGKVFRTQEEAEGYEKLYRKKTGVFLAIERTNRAVTHTFDKNAKDAISPDQPDVIKVTTRYPDYIDFIIGSDKQNLYRYEKATGKMRKLIGYGKGNFGNAIRGIDRKKVESVAKIVFERKLPFAVIA